MNLDLIAYKDKQDEMFDKLFNIEDIRVIKTTRRKFEDDINKTNDKKVYFAYIKYEIYLWKKIRNKTCNINVHKTFAKMVISLHRVALKHHKDDLAIWLSFIKFCMESDFTHLLSEIFFQMLSHHTDEHLWLLASKWELEEHNNICIAIAHLHRALSHHPLSTSIYCEIFRLELESSKFLHHPTSLHKTEKEVEAKAIKLFFTIQNKIPKDVNLHINLFKIASKYSFSIKLQTIIADNMIKNFADKEEVWEILANKELEGHHFTKSNGYEFIPASSSDIRLNNLIKKYRYAVQIMNTEVMWTKYLNTLLELLEDEKHNNVDLKETFMNACKTAHDKRLLSEDIYIKWIEYLEGNTELLQILKVATVEKPKCIPLWVARIRYYINNNISINQADKEIEKIFSEAIKILGENSIQIWRLKIQYYQINLKSDQSVIESVYRAGLKYSPTISKLLKPQFLDWIVLFKSSDATFDEYKKLATEKPWCLELHKKMAELEAMYPEPNEEILKFVSELAISQFGEDTWMEYVQEEISCGPQWKKHVFSKYLMKL